ncbi:MAG: leucine-rich repeat protein [Prevotella sp.]|nr:leucine-rich repeat protein [Prevotella sp.]
MEKLNVFRRLCSLCVVLFAAIVPAMADGTGPKLSFESIKVTNASAETESYADFGSYGKIEAQVVKDNKAEYEIKIKNDGDAYKGEFSLSHYRNSADAWYSYETVEWDLPANKTSTFHVQLNGRIGHLVGLKISSNDRSVKIEGLQEPNSHVCENYSKTYSFSDGDICYLVGDGSHVAGPLLSFESIKILNASEEQVYGTYHYSEYLVNKVYGTKATFEFKIKNDGDAYNGDFEVLLNTGEQNSREVKKVNLQLPAKSTTAFQYSVDGEVGKTVGISIMSVDPTVAIDPYANAVAHASSWPVERGGIPLKIYDGDICYLAGKSGGDDTGTPADEGTEFDVSGLSYKVKADQTVEVIPNDSYKSLESVTIPDAVTFNNYEYPVTSIANSAFENCGQLKSATIGNSVTTIGNWAFRLTGLTSITLGSSVTEIGPFAFRLCTSLTSVNIPKTVTSMGNGIFSGCENLTEINIDSSNPNYCAVQGVIYSKDMTVLHSWPNTTASFTVPNSVTEIYPYAFNAGTKLTSVTLPNSLITIGECAFGGCNSITSINIPASVKFMNIGVFAYCQKLNSINVDEGNAEYSSVDGVLYSKDVTTLVTCPGGLKSLTVPATVTAIGSNAFQECTLSSIVLPNSLKKIKYQAFFLCKNLTSINIPNSVEVIEEGAFTYSGLAELVLGKSVKSIASTAFYCDNLTSVYCNATTPPDAVEWSFYSLDPVNYTNAIFDKCTLYVPQGSIDAYSASEPWSNFKNIVGISNKLSYNITSSTQNTVEVIASASDKYSGDVVIPQAITYNGKTYTVIGIADDAFSGCTGITSVTVGSKETADGSNVTNNPVAVKTRAASVDGFIVGARAFKGCTNLQSATLGDVVTGVGDEAFAGCTSLMSVACESANPPGASENIFDDNTYRDAVLTVPEAFSAVYQTTAPWSRFAKVTTGIGNVTVDNDAQPHKIFLNGKLIIRKNGKSYNLQGVEIK